MNPQDQPPAPAPPTMVYLSFTGMIEPSSVTKIGASLNQAVNTGATSVYLCLSSAGGVVADGIFLYNHLRALPIPVTIHNTGTVASIAVAAFCGAKTRLCSQHGIFLIHPTTVTSAGGKSAQQLEAGLASALADDQRMENILRERTTMPDELLSKRLIGDVWITPAVAMQYGLVHGIEEFALPPGQNIYQV